MKSAVPLSDEEKKQRNRLAVKKYQAKNKDKIAAYRLKNKDRDKEYRRVHHQLNRDKNLATNAVWYAANMESAKARSAQYYADNKSRVLSMHRRWRENNMDKATELKRRWIAANPERYRENSLRNAHNRRARLAHSGGRLSRGLAAKLFKLQKGKCACCGKPLGRDFDRDHIMPLALGGLNVDSNIQLLTSRCNRQKNAKHPVDFMQQRGFLI